MPLPIPLSKKALTVQLVFVASLTSYAFLYVLPGLVLFPYGHLFFGVWILWRANRACEHLLLLLSWTRCHTAKPITVKTSQKGLMIGDGFIWTGEHVYAIERYLERFKSLPQEPSERGGSPAIHGCHRQRSKRIVLPYERLRSHVALEGSTQSGKTRLLANLVAQAIAANQGATVIMDPKGSDDLTDAAMSAAARYHRRFALIRPRLPEQSERFNMISSCQEPTDLPGRLRPLFPEGREAYFKEEPLALLQRVSAMHKKLGWEWDIRHLHRDVMDLESLKFTLIQYMNILGAPFSGVQKAHLPSFTKIKTEYASLGIEDPLIPQLFRPLVRTQEAHNDRFGNMDIALSGIIDVDHSEIFGAEASLTWDEIDHEEMVVIFRTDSLVTDQIGRNIASLFFQDFMGYMGLRYLHATERRRPITIFVDEVGEVVYPNFRHAINKVGEAGGRLILTWQTDFDLDAQLMKKAEADVIRANCQSRITMRLAHAEAAATISELSPEVTVEKRTASQVRLMGLKGSKGITVEHEKIQLLNSNLLKGQPVGQCFLELDGSLYHVNIPREIKV